MTSGNIASNITFDRVDTTYNADNTVATRTLYSKGVQVGLITYTYTNGLETKAELTLAKYTG